MTEKFIMEYELHKQIGLKAEVRERQRTKEANVAGRGKEMKAGQTGERQKSDRSRREETWRGFEYKELKAYQDSEDNS